MCHTIGSLEWIDRPPLAPLKSTCRDKETGCGNFDTDHLTPESGDTHLNFVINTWHTARVSGEDFVVESCSWHEEEADEDSVDEKL